MTSLPLPIDPAHPAFAGHFPARPILPGVVLLDHGLRAIDAQRRPDAAQDAAHDTNAAPACRIGAAKFLSFVLPGEPVRLEIEWVDATPPTGQRDCRLRIYAGAGDGERLAVTGSVFFDPASSTAGPAD